MEETATLTGVGEVAAARPAATELGMAALIRSDIERWLDLWMGHEGVDANTQSSAEVRKARRRLGWYLTMNYCGIRATILYRISHVLWRKHIPLLPQMLSQWNLMMHGLDIPACVPIGPRLYIPHPVGTVVMASNIGSNLTLVSGITIGMRATPRFPTIGDGVFIGAGARVLGDIKIEDGANIGANAVVLKDVPAGATAVGIPAAIKYPKAEVVKEMQA